MDLGSVVFFGFMEATEEPRNNMGVFGVIVVTRSVEVSRHSGVIDYSVLFAVGLAKFEPSDFSNGIGFVCLL